MERRKEWSQRSLESERNFARLGCLGFREFRDKAKSDPLLRFGLQWLDSHRIEIPTDIAKQIRDALADVAGRTDRVKHPLLAKVKYDLRAFAADISASKLERQETNILAIDLLIYAGTVAAQSH